MSAQTRKLEIIERVLHLEDDESLSAVEKVLEMRQTAILGEDEVPMMPARTSQEIAALLTQARADVQAGRTLTSDELRTRAKQWRAA